MSKKNYLKGGITLNQACHDIGVWIETCHGKVDKYFDHEDGTVHNNKIAKEQLKYKDTFELVSNLPNEFKEIKYELKRGAATQFEKPSKLFKTWLTEVGKKITENGYSDLFFEIPIPATGKNKFDINTNDVSSDVKNKFMPEWKKENLYLSKDLSKRKALAIKLAPKLSGLDKNALITDLPETKEIFGNTALLCWNCVSEV